MDNEKGDAERDAILDHGYSVQYADTNMLSFGNLPRAHTVGRNLFGRPEILIVGPFTKTQAIRMLADLVALDETIGLVTGEVVDAQGLSWRLDEADPTALLGAMLALGGINALQAVWAKPDGTFPGEPQMLRPPGFHPLHATTDPYGDDPVPSGLTVDAKEQADLSRGTVDLIHPAPINETERIRMKETGVRGQVELRMHSFILPLAPGDIVAVNDGCITDVVSLRPQYVYEVHFHLPKDFLSTPMADGHPAVRKADALVAKWKRDVEITELTTFSMLMSTASQEWFNDNVRFNKFVAHVEVIRTPDQREVVIP